ncbi:hypothetical protein [Arthrobacter glacialis]|uniref:hypothetical protein n=1 Tax=Arthrobacter glacialis TaxID=1664 RepID=UPI000CD453EA|nr:hypothetical protein [Arthrobacter glacialis]POH58926.1 hypothetical protein CVS28_09470 [Arthrobacter glacialis]
MYRFLICEFFTGKVLDELPMIIASDLTRYLKMYGEGTLSLPLFDGRGQLVSDTWEQAILPMRSLILVVDDADRIVWNGVPQSRGRNTSSKVSFPCRTTEAALIGRYVPDLDFAKKDQARIFQSVVESMTAGGIGLDYDCPNTGILRDRTYATADNARVYDRVNELSAVLQGFDWTIDVVWGDDTHSWVRKIVRTGYPHLGNRTEHPAHVLETGQNITDFDYQEPWGEGQYATHVVAVGDGEGVDRVMSDPVIDHAREAAGWPRVEYRKAFSSVKDKTTLNSHARALAGYVFGGQQVLTATARNPLGAEDFTSLGDLTLGDAARVIVDTPQLQLNEAWPVIGWSLTPKTGIYKPTMARIGEPVE